MADSEALRARRYRAHQAGDHHLCIVGRCPDLGPDAAQRAAAEATARLVAAVEAEFPEDDPLSRALALRLVDLSGGRAPPRCRRSGHWGSWSPTSVTAGRDPYPLAAPVAAGADRAARVGAGVPPGDVG